MWVSFTCSIISNQSSGLQWKWIGCILGTHDCYNTPSRLAGLSRCLLSLSVPVLESSLFASDSGSCQNIKPRVVLNLWSSCLSFHSSWDHNPVPSSILLNASAAVADTSMAHTGLLSSRNKYLCIRSRQMHRAFINILLIWINKKTNL